MTTTPPAAPQPPIETCPKCGAQGVAFICDTPGCPVNGGAAYGPAAPQPGDAESRRAERIADLLRRRADVYHPAREAHPYYGDADIDLLRVIIDARDAEITRLRAELSEIRKAEHSLSAAYVRLRAMIPGALDTPHAPSSEQIWRITEDALSAAQTTAEAQAGEIERLRRSLSNAALLVQFLRKHEADIPWQSAVDMLDGIDIHSFDSIHTGRLLETRQPKAGGEDAARARDLMREMPYRGDRHIERVASALTAARRAGAEAMRERAATYAETFGRSDTPEQMAAAIRALPTDTDAPIPEWTR